jgi:hypothetical protein
MFSSSKAVYAQTAIAKVVVAVLQVLADVRLWPRYTAGHPAVRRLLAPTVLLAKQLAHGHCHITRTHEVPGTGSKQCIWHKVM